MQMLPVVVRPVVEQREVKPERFLDDAFVVVDLRKGAVGLGKEYAVPWFGRIEGRIVDDHWERERFGAEERKIAEQSGHVRTERKDAHALGGLLHRYSDRGQAAAQYRDRGGLRIGEPFWMILYRHGKDLDRTVYLFVVRVLQAQPTVPVLNAFD